MVHPAGGGRGADPEDAVPRPALSPTDTRVEAADQGGARGPRPGRDVRQAMTDLLPGYRRYRQSEEVADRCIHVLGIGLGIGAALALLYLAALAGEARLLLATAVYALGLV